MLKRRELLLPFSRTTAAHPESILLSALQGKQLTIREKAVQKIVDARKKPKAENVRHFSLPKCFNLAASDYCSLIDMSKKEITEPPLTMDMTDEQLMVLIQGHSSIPNAIQCHSQNMESTVADVTQASLVAEGYEK